MSLSSPSLSNGIIVISCKEKSTENVIQNILGVCELPNASIEVCNFKGYEWKIKTKYYSATATLFSIQEKREFDKNFAESIQATVFYFDGKEPASFESIQSWMPLLKSVTSEVQLLICDNFSHDETYQKNVLNWCIENQFELVDLQEEVDKEDGDVISNPGGYRRVIEALHTCSWNDIVLSNKDVNNKDDKDENVANGEATASNIDVKSDEKAKKVTVDDDVIKLEEEWFQNVLEQDEPGQESFEALFAKFASMKEKASNLNGEDRKKYAEKVAIAFCRAMGCEDEIEGLDDD